MSVGLSVRMPGRRMTDSARKIPNRDRRYLRVSLFKTMLHSGGILSMYLEFEVAMMPRCSTKCQERQALLRSPAGAL